MGGLQETDVFRCWEPFLCFARLQSSKPVYEVCETSHSQAGLKCTTVRWCANCQPFCSHQAGCITLVSLRRRYALSFARHIWFAQRLPVRYLGSLWHHFQKGCCVRC